MIWVSPSTLVLNLGDWCKPVGNSGTESRTEQNRAENEFPLHPGDMVSFRGERFC